MKLKNNNNHLRIPQWFTIEIVGVGIRRVKFLLLVIAVFSCTDFVEVDPPKNTLISATVFEDPATVKSALANIYYNMREQGMVSGNFGLSVLMGIYTDELDYYGLTSSNVEFFNHNITPSNSLILSWWNQAYSLIYAANDIIKGVDNSTTLTWEDQAQFKGQALFVRGYLHSLLVGLFGDVPYITTTNYLENNIAVRMPVNLVYEHIITDITDAVSLLNSNDLSGERVLPNQSVAKALLARMYLYTNNWEQAELTSSELINSYSLEPDINTVFKNNSSETLWQFKPNGISHLNTYEANQLVIRFIPGQSYALSDALWNAFEPHDLRLLNWIGSESSSDGLTTLHYANKYKALFNETVSIEYSIIFRLTEQYLIRAEARAHLGDVFGAQSDLNRIRNRAGLSNTMAATQTDLLDAILQERQLELFSEHGQRWFDIKRLDRAEDVLSPIKINWQISHMQLPIPDTELELNPNLKPQNPGY